MRTQLLIRGAMVAATLASALVGFAKAEEYKGPPPQGWQGFLKNPYVVCDTKEQVTNVSRAGKDNYEGFTAKLNEYANIRDDKDKPTCSFEPVGVIVVWESEVIGISRDAHNSIFMTWAVHFGNLSGKWWMLYYEGGNAI